MQMCTWAARKPPMLHWPEGNRATIVNNLPSRPMAIRALAITAAGVLLLHGQLVAHLTTHVIGRSFEDAFEVLWQLEWLGHALFTLRTNPFFTPDIYYPVGWHLATGAQPVWYLLLLAPAVPLAGATAVYNTTLLALLIVAAFGVWRLAYRLTAHFGAAFLAAFGYILAPVVAIRLAGHLHMLIGIALLPHAMLALLSAFAAPQARARQRAAVVAGLLLGATVLAHWYYLLIAPLLPAALLLWPPARTRQAVGAWMRVGVLAAAMVLPFALLAQRARDNLYDPTAMAPRRHRQQFSCAVKPAVAAARPPDLGGLVPAAVSGHRGA